MQLIWLCCTYNNHIFSCKHVLQDLNIEDLRSELSDCPFASSSCIYNRTDHFIASNLNIPSNTSLLAKMLKYCVPKSIWKHH